MVTLMQVRGEKGKKTTRKQKKEGRRVAEQPLNRRRGKNRGNSTDGQTRSSFWGRGERKTRDKEENVFVSQLLRKRGFTTKLEKEKKRPRVILFYVKRDHCHLCSI